jgi:hypothetical protein
MLLSVEFEREEVAEQAYRELRVAGFDNDSVQIAHPFDGGTLVTVRAFAEDVAVAAEVLSRHEGEESPASQPQTALEPRSRSPTDRLL